MKQPLLLDDRGDIAPGKASGGASDVFQHRHVRTLRYKWKRYWVNEGPKFVWIALWLMGNIGLFAYNYIAFSDPSRPGYNLLGPGLAVAKSGASLIRLNSALLMLAVARNIFTWLRETFPRLTYWVPFDKNIVFHRYLGGAVAIGTAIHVGAHFYNFRTLVSTADGRAFLVAKGQLSASAADASEWLVAFTTLVGLTGVIILISMIIMYTAASHDMRRTAFEAFWYTHNLLFLVYIGLNIAHGMSAIFSPPQFWMWIVGPMAIYLIERVVRFVRSRQRTIVLQAIQHPANVIELRMKKLLFNFKPGMYLNLTVPYLTRLEDHPFTISSAPEQDFVSVHIQAVGDWTNALTKMLNPEGKLGLVQTNLSNAPDGSPILTIDGPYGAASEDVFDKKIVMLVGAGIGVTPFASVLQSIRYRMQLMHQNAPNARQIPIQKVYFMWISRDKSAFEWIDLERSPFGKYLDIRIYITGKFDASAVKTLMVADATSSKDVLTGLDSKTRFGRPNWDVILPEIALLHPNEEVDIFFCGPPLLSKTLYKRCRKYTQPAPATRFHFHKENF